MQNIKKNEDTKKNLIDASNLIEPNKIPVTIDISGWAYKYAGVTYEEVIDNPEKNAECYCKFFLDVPVDIVLFNSFIHLPMRSLQALGMNEYILSIDKTGVVHDQTLRNYCGPEVYDEVVDDPIKFSSETWPKRLIPAFSLPEEEAYDALKKAAIEYKKYALSDALIGKHLRELGIFTMFESEMFFSSPFQRFFDSYRGIKNALVDLRRYPEKVKAACDAIWESEAMFRQFDPEVIKNPLPVANWVYHPEGFFSPKQYEEYSFEYLKKGYLPMFEAGKKMFILGEGSFINKIERIRDLPKGSIIIQIDQDDPFEVKKLVGDWCTICAGIKIDLLQLGTKQQCIDYVKRSFDELAPGGGFVFQPNQQLVTGLDAKIENVIAVYETADELSRQ